MKSWWKNNSSGDELVLSSGVFTAQNTTAEKSLVAKKDNLTIKEGSAIKNEQTSSLIKLTNDVGHTLQLSATNGVVITQGSVVITLNASGLSITNGTGTTTVSLLQLLHNNGSGKTNSMTDEQMVIAGDGKMGIFEADSVSLDDGSKTAEISTTGGVELGNGSNSAELTTARMQIIIGSASATVTPEAGLTAISDGKTAQIGPAAGVNLNGGSGGTVVIQSVAGEAVSLQDTSVCEDEDGLPAPATAYVLRSATHLSS